MGYRRCYRFLIQNRCILLVSKRQSRFKNWGSHRVVRASFFAFWWALQNIDKKDLVVHATSRLCHRERFFSTHQTFHLRSRLKPVESWLLRNVWENEQHQPIRKANPQTLAEDRKNQALVASDGCTGVFCWKYRILKDYDIFHVLVWWWSSKYCHTL